jgi:O-antigen/teichoic acid export membrane protein
MPTSSAWRRYAPRAHSLLAESWPFILSGVSIAAYSRVDQILVKELLGDRSLGIYAAALPLAQFWQVIPVILATSLAPFIARFKQADEAGYRRALVLVFRAFFYLGVAIAIVTFAVSDLLVGLLFGAEFAEAAGVLNVLGIANVFCFLGIAHGLWLVNEKRFAVRLYGTLLAGFVAVALNFALLPRLGIIGAAWAATAAQLVAAFLINLLLDRQSFRMQMEAIFFRKTQIRVEGNR